MACYFSLPTISRFSLRASFQLLTLFKSSKDTFFKSFQVELFVLLLLKRNKVGNWRGPFCTQNLRNLRPVVKIKLGTRDVSFWF